MKDRAKIIIAGIVAAAALAVALIITLIPKRHVIEVEGTGPILVEEKPADFSFLEDQIADAEKMRSEVTDPTARANLEEVIAKAKKDLADLKAGRTPQK